MGRGGKLEVSDLVLQLGGIDLVLLGLCPLSVKQPELLRRVLSLMVEGGIGHTSSFEKVPLSHARPQVQHSIPSPL